jgi:ElaB/YqjD/DUF883 family membrane-anchored ribosome-binding protein
MARFLRRSASATSLDAGEVGQLLQDLEQRLSQIAAFVTANTRQASNVVPDRVSEALSDVADRFRTSLRHNARFFGDEASRMGSTALHRVEHEVTHRPLVALAIAAGIGFMIGALNRR